MLFIGQHPANDHIVVYDRAISKTDGRFKRFWLNLPTEAEIAGNFATSKELHPRLARVRSRS